jgi:hypothetical protein
VTKLRHAGPAASRAPALRDCGEDGIELEVLGEVDDELASIRRRVGPHRIADDLEVPRVQRGAGIV